MMIPSDGLGKAPVLQRATLQPTVLEKKLPEAAEAQQGQAPERPAAGPGAPALAGKEQQQQQHVVKWQALQAH